MGIDASQLTEGQLEKLIEYPKGKRRLSQMTCRDEKYLREIVECALNTGMPEDEILRLTFASHVVIRGGYLRAPQEILGQATGL